MSLERKIKFKQPPMPQTQTIAPLTPDIAPNVNRIAKEYGTFLSSKLGQPSLSFADYLKGVDLSSLSTSLGASPELTEATSMFRKPVDVTGPTDTSSIYRTALEQGNRNFQQYALPQILESFGRRGARYGSDVAGAGARSYGDLMANILAKSAEAEVGAKEAYAGRRMTGEQIRTQRAAGLGNIGQIIQAILEANMGRARQDYQLRSPENYMQSAQSFLGTQPIFPQTLVGPSAIGQEKPNAWDYVNQVLKTGQGIASVAGAFAKGGAGA